MARPDPALLDPERYPFRCSIETRFSDLDVNLHVNNVAMAGILEHGRVRFHYASGYREALQGRTSMVASLAIEYLGQARYPEPLELHAGALALGRTSHQLAQLVIQEGKVIAFARTVLVSVGKEGPAPHPQDFIDGFQRWLVAA